VVSSGLTRERRRLQVALLLALTSGRAGQSRGPRNAQLYFLVSIHSDLMTKVSVTPARDSWRDGDPDNGNLWGGAVPVA
jgi:hypothetical protein